MKQGDLCIRKSYGGDVLFRIEQLARQQALLRGVDYRLLADAPTGDLTVLRHPEEYRKWPNRDDRAEETLRSLERDQQSLRDRIYERLSHRSNETLPYFELPGKVLHIDGDSAYLRKSMQLYTRFRVPAEGYYVPERNMAEVLFRLLPQSRPDIVVITGHDGVLKHRKQADLYKLSSYKNSLNFVNAVHVARQYERNRDTLTVIAGACQSHFEALLQAGSNFASSPARILIHALDPVYIAIKSSYTSIRDTINISDVIRHTMSGLEGVGGLESRGSFRIGLPNLYDSSSADSVSMSPHS